MEGDVNDSLCVIVQLVSILKHAQLLSIIRHNIFMYTNKNRKQKGGIQIYEYSIVMKK